MNPLTLPSFLYIDVLLMYTFTILTVITTSVILTYVQQVDKKVPFCKLLTGTVSSGEIPILL